MILFIAMVLVAAVASAVLISTSNSVREQATQTGSAAIYGTAAGFNVENVWGDVKNNAIDELDVYLSLVPGSPAECISGTVVTLTVSSVSKGTSFSDNMELNNSNTFFSTQTGELEIYIQNIDISPNDNVVIRVIPASGSMSVIDFTVPDAFMTSIVLLR